jgi:adenylate cyclase
MGLTAADSDTGRLPPLRASYLNRKIKPNPMYYIKSNSFFAAPLEVLADAAAGVGSFTATPESDGVLRRVPLLMGVWSEEKKKVTDMYPALVLEAVRIALGKQMYVVHGYGDDEAETLGIQSIAVGDFAIPVDKAGFMQVYYAGHRQSLYIPVWKLLAGEVDPALVKGKIAFVGTSAAGLKDLRSSPLDNVLPGVELHAEMAEQILNKQFLRRPVMVDTGEQIAIALVSLFIIFLSPYIGTGTLAMLTGVLAVGGYFGGLYVYQNYGYLLDPVYPTLAITLIFIVSSVLTNLRSELEKRMIRQAFDRYLAPDLIEELVKNPEKLRLGGEVRELTVMFTDIRNFTTISESMDPAELIRMMNDFLTPMTSAVLDNKGFVDKYMGDAMMTFWNAPVDMPQHAEFACRAALEMAAALKPVNAELKLRAEKANRPFHELKAGIGINSGRASVGNMGSKQRFAYSALGDTVNLASRLEGQTKAYGVSTMISSATRQQAGAFATIELDLLAVKGRVEPERVYALLGAPEEAKSEAFAAFAAKHEQMLEAYRGSRWGEAMMLTEDCEKLRPDLAQLYKLYRDRIAAYKQTPPPAGWNGVWVAKDK